MAQTVSRRSIVYDLTFDTGNSKKAASDVSKDLDKIGGSIDKAANEITEFSNKTTSAVQRLRQIKNELNSFKGTEERFRALTLEAAKLQDQLNKTNDRIRTLSSSTKNIQALISVASGLTGVFTAAQGAVALFGDKNENLQKTLVKLQGSLALLQGVQAAISTVTEESAAKTVILANAQKFYSFVVGASTGALKGFRIALAATGVGLLIIALGTLIANFDKVKATVLEFIPALEKVGSVIKGLVAGFVEYFKVIGDVIATFFNDGLGAAIDAAKDGGKRISDAYNEGFNENEKQKEKERQTFIANRFIRDAKLQKDLLEAQGKDTFELQKQILQRELQQLDKHSDEYATKLNELNIIIIKNNEKARLSSINSIANIGKQIQELQDQLSNTEIGTQQFFALTEQIKLLNVELEAAKDLAEGLQELDLFGAKEIENATKNTEGFVEVQAKVNESIKVAEKSLQENKQTLLETSEVYKILSDSAQSAGQTFGNLAQLAAANSNAQIGLAIAGVIASQAESLARGVAEAVKIGFPQNIPAVFTTIATLTSVFAQIHSISQQAKAAQAAAAQNQFAEGVIDLHRPGEKRGEDSIPSLLMPGESVITTDKTARYKPFLEAIHAGNLEDLIKINFIEPALALQALDNSRNDSKMPDYSEKFYRQYLVTGEGNSIHKKSAKTLERIEKKLGKTIRKRYV